VEDSLINKRLQLSNELLRIANKPYNLETTVTDEARILRQAGITYNKS